MPPHHEELSIRSVQVLPHLSIDGLLPFEITQHVLPSTVAIEVDSIIWETMIRDASRIYPSHASGGNRKTGII
jgi:hypothetical protein